RIVHSQSVPHLRRRPGPTLAIVCLPPGVTMPPAHWAEGFLLTLDATCRATPAGEQPRGAGTVTLTEADGGSYAGSFEMTFEGGEHLAGSFQVPDCPAIDANLDAGAFGCQ